MSGLADAAVHHGALLRAADDAVPSGATVIRNDAVTIDATSTGEPQPAAALSSRTVSDLTSPIRRLWNLTVVQFQIALRLRLFRTSSLVRELGKALLH